MTGERLSLKARREVNTYAEMWHTSWCLLDAGRSNPEGSAHQFRASLVFTAFTLEACLNHIGPKVFDCWDDLESLGPSQKLSLLCERLGVDTDYSRRPWQVMKPLFQFRNDIAHGKSAVVQDHRVDKADAFPMPTRVQTRWEAYGTERNAIRAREDVESIIRSLFDAGAFEHDSPFWMGSQVATLGPAHE
jgi:hypothetical protein